MRTEKEKEKEEEMEGALIDIDKVWKLILSTNVHLKWHIDGFTTIFCFVFVSRLNCVRYSAFLATFN